MNGGKYGNTEPFPFSMKLLASDRPDQSCHHEVWLHMDFVEQRNGQAHHERHEERRLLLKERPAPYHYRKPKYQTGEDASDHSLSSYIRRPFATKARFPMLTSTPRRPSSTYTVRSSRPSAVDLMRRQHVCCMSSVSCFLYYLPHSIPCTCMSLSYNPSNWTCATKKNERVARQRKIVVKACGSSQRDRFAPWIDVFGIGRR